MGLGGIDHQEGGEQTDGGFSLSSTLQRLTWLAVCGCPANFNQSWISEVLYRLTSFLYDSEAARWRKWEFIPWMIKGSEAVLFWASHTAITCIQVDVYAPILCLFGINVWWKCPCSCYRKDCEKMWINVKWSYFCHQLFYQGHRCTRELRSSGSSK